MKRSLVLFSIGMVSVGCNESSQPSEPIEVTVDTFNVALAGAFIPYESERRQPIVEAIAATNSDIICLQEVWNQADKELIRDGALAAYPYSALFRDDLDTPVDDPTDQNDQVPPPPTGVPCPDEEASDGMNILAQMNQAVDCVMANCSTTPDATPPEDELGRTTSAECASANCVGQVAGLLFGDAAQQRCYACVITQLPTSTFGRMRDDRQPRPGFRRAERCDDPLPSSPEERRQLGHPGDMEPAHDPQRHRRAPERGRARHLLQSPHSDLRRAADQHVPLHGAVWRRDDGRSGLAG